MPVGYRMNHKIDPQLAQLAVPLTELRPDPRNARLHNERNIVAVMDSYRAHGQRKPIVVQKTADDGAANVVRAGNGQVEAARRLGWTHIAAIFVDERDTAAIAFALRDNRTADLAEWDYQVLAAEEARFELAGEDTLLAYGWSEAELNPLRETTWFQSAKGTLEDHQRPPKPDEDEDTAKKFVVKPDDAAQLEIAAAMMREKFKEPGMTLSKIIGRLSKHYVATLSHSASEQPKEKNADGN